MRERACTYRRLPLAIREEELACSVEGHHAGGYEHYEREIVQREGFRLEDGLQPRQIHHQHLYQIVK